MMNSLQAFDNQWYFTDDEKALKEIAQTPYRGNSTLTFAYTPKTGEQFVVNEIAKLKKEIDGLTSQVAVKKLQLLNFEEELKKLQS